jgi:hypothetical protein
LDASVNTSPMRVHFQPVGRCRDRIAALGTTQRSISCHQTTIGRPSVALMLHPPWVFVGFFRPAFGLGGFPSQVGQLLDGAVDIAGGLAHWRKAVPRADRTR